MASPPSPPPARSTNNGFLSSLAQLRKFSSFNSGYKYLQVGKLLAIAYTPYVLPSPLIILSFAVRPLFTSKGDMASLFDEFAGMRTSALLLATVPFSFMALLCVVLFVQKLRTPPCYLVDFASFKPVQEHKLFTEYCVQLSQVSKRLTQKNMLFQVKVLLKSGLGDGTYGPAFLFKFAVHERVPTRLAARGKTDHMMIGDVNELLTKASLAPAKIDFLIVNAWLAVDLAKDLLKVHRNKYVMVLGAENITLNWYYGNDKSMLVPNHKGL